MSEEDFMEKRVAKHQRPSQSRMSCVASKDSLPINGKNGSKYGNGARGSQLKPYQAEQRRLHGEVQRNRSFPDKRPLSKATDDVYLQKGSGSNTKWQKKQIAEWRAEEARGSKLRYQHHYPIRRAEFYNKEQYLQSICQFVVLQGNNYGIYLHDADVLVDWELIQEVRLFDEDVPACPICIEPPVAAKITRCGHVYCWPCMLHYLALSDKSWRKCPICYDSVYKDQLRSVVSCASRRYVVGDTLEFGLMKRDKTSTVAFPINSWEELDKPMKANDPEGKWCKLLTISPNEACELICERERIELKAAYGDQIDQPERVFIMEALECLELRLLQLRNLEVTMESINSQPTESCVEKSATIALLNDCPVDKITSAPVPDYWNVDTISEDVEVSPEKEQVAFFLPDVAATADVDGDIKDATLREDDISSFSSQPVDGACAMNCGSDNVSSKTHDRDRFYYFYQAVDGQRIFLHPINVRCLITEYGSLKYAPKQIKGKILELNRITMDDDTRKRFKPLGHLPLTTTFTLAELKFDYGILSRGTIDMFAEEFRRRKDARQKKARREKFQERKVEQWHQTLLAQQRADCGYAVGLPEEYRSRSGNPEIPYIKYVPSAQNDILAQTSPSSQDLPLLGSSPDDALPSTSSDADETHHMSFAEMLKLGKRKTEETVSALPTGTPSASTDDDLHSKAKAVVSDDETTVVGAGGSCSAPNYRDTFGDALAAAIDAINVNSKESTSGQDGKAAKSGKGKKGKRSRGKLLFST